MIEMAQMREVKRNARHKRIRKKVMGSTEQPRLCVHRSLNNLYAQLVDDTQAKVLMGASTLDKSLKAKIKSGGNLEGAKVLGAFFAVEAKKKGIKKVCFDRGGYLYHGRVKAFAEAARENGLEF